MIREGMPGKWFPHAEQTNGRVLGTLSVGSTEPGAFGSTAVAMVEAVARQVALVVVDNALPFQKIEQLNEKLTLKCSYLESEILSKHGFDSIVGDGDALPSRLRKNEEFPTGSDIVE
jgi:transcriptional regulator with GAF, ATPase, and Fis domain